MYTLPVHHHAIKNIGYKTMNHFHLNCNNFKQAKISPNFTLVQYLDYGSTGCRVFKGRIQI